MLENDEFSNLAGNLHHGVQRDGEEEAGRVYGLCSFNNLNYYFTLILFLFLTCNISKNIRICKSVSLLITSFLVKLTILIYIFFLPSSFQRSRGGRL